MKPLEKIKARGPALTTIGQIKPTTKVSAQPVNKEKKKSKAGILVGKLGGVDNILSTGGELINKAGTFIKNSKNKPTGGNDFDLGVGEPEEPTSGDIFGVPKASFWTLVGVLTLIFLSLAFFIGSRK